MFYILQFTVAYVYTLRNCKIIVVILSAFFIHFYPRDGAQVLAVVVCLSVCLFVCLSVPLSSVRLTSRCSTKTAKRRITQTTPHDSPGTLGFPVPKISAKLKRGHPNRGAKCRWGNLNAGVLLQAQRR